jgi:hypothetical protein
MTESLFEPPQPPTVVIDDPRTVADFLSTRIKVTVADLHDALDAATADAATVTDNSPHPAFGWRMYEGIIKTLRESKVSEWEAKRPDGLEVVRRRDNRVQITASAGNAATGIAAGRPTCKHPRGSATAKAVDKNQLTYADIAPEFKPIETWWLLWFVSTASNGEQRERRVRAELSLPTLVHEGSIQRWRYRVLIGERSFGTVTTVPIPEPAPDPTFDLPWRAEG